MRRHIDLRLILSTLLALVIACVLMVAPAAAQGTGYSISLSPSAVQPGGPVSISWSRPNDTLQSFFGVFRANNFVNQLTFTFPSATGNNGTASIQAPDEPGGYWVVWIAGGVFQTKAFFQVILPGTAGSVPGYSLSINPNPVNAGANVSINWTKPSGASTGLIVLYDSFLNSPGRGVFTYLDSVTPIGDTSGTATFTAPSLPGGYWFGWISLSDFELKAVVPFSVALNEADSTAPTVSISTPANNAAVSGTAQAVSASASDNIGVAGVQFQLDGVNLGAERTTAPYSIAWDTTNFNNGQHFLTAVARDAAGNRTTSTTIAVNVNNSTTAPGSPSKSSPGNGSTGQHHVPKLQWGTASGATSYEYCVDTSNNSVCDTSWLSVGTKTSVFVGGLNSATTYFWQVRAVNNAGQTEANSGAWWSFTTSAIHVNVAAAVNGAIASASSTLGAGYSPAATINGDRKGLNFGNGGVWTDGTPGGFPDWVEIDFAGPQTIDEVDVFTAQDNLSNPLEPTLGMTFTQNGITDYEVQYWNGLYWARTFVGDFNGNNQVWRQISFEPITTRKIRVFISGAINSVSRITEIEAYSDVPDVPGPLAKSAPANGSTGRSFNPTLTWGDSRSALSYEYCIDTINNNVCDTTWVSTGGTTSVVVSGLNLGTKYYWQARARNTAGPTEADGATWWNFTTSVSYVNVAAAVNGAIAIASSTLDTGYGASGVINGDRKGLNWGNGGGWNDGTEKLYPDWVEVDFAGPQTLSEINVFTLQDDYPNPSEPVLGMPFNLFGITDFQVQSWNGTAWVTVPGGDITGNNQVWRQIPFNPFTTEKIRVFVTGANNSFSRITEIEAYSDLNSAPGALTKIGPANNVKGQARFTSLGWTASRGATSYEYCIDTINNNSCDTSWQSLSGVNVLLSGIVSGTTYYWQVRARNGIGVVEADNNTWWSFSSAFTHLNVAAAINGGTALASSVLDAGFSPAGTINGDRKGLNWGNGGGWNDASGNSFPDWLEVDFNGPQTIDEIDVFTLQDDFNNPVEPTTSTPFTLYGLTSFQLQYWDGQAWVNITGGNITGNNRVWRQIGFGNITTSKIRVNVTGGLNGFSRITEVEAYSDLDIFPGAFSKTSPANGATKQARFTLLNWTASSASTTYEFCVDQIANASCDSVWQSTANTSVLLSNLSSGTTYYWQIRALNGAGVELADNGAWWSFTTGFTHLNVAAALNGATASASSTLAAGFAPSGTINGDRKGLNWGNGGGWNDASEQFFPDWLQVDFAGPQTIDEIDVFTLQDNLNNPVEPTTNLPFTQYGLTAFQAQYWNGLAWVNIPGASITGNNLVWRQFGFANVTTSKIRINVTGAMAGYSRITEVEAYSDVDILPGELSKISPANVASGQARYPSLTWTASSGATAYEYCVDTINNNNCDTSWGSTFSTNAPLNALVPGTTYYWQVRARNGAGVLDADGGAWWGFTVSMIHVNVAAAVNGATAIASSTLEVGYAPAGAINGDRKGLNWGNGGGWNDGSASSFPDWLEVDFAGAQTIDEVNVFTLQDNFGSPVEPTPQTPFTLFGVTDFQVQYWDGANWNTVTGGSITGNNLIWRQIFFNSVTTTKIRIFVTGGLNAYSRITEVEAYSDVLSLPGLLAKSGPTNGSAGQSHVPTLSWSASSGATNYEVCVDTIPNNACDGSWQNTGASTSAIIGGLNPETAYYWEVRARNGAGTVEADNGAWWSFSTGIAYNVAAAANGGIATASSTRHEGFAPIGAINGDRRGLNWGNGGGWADGTEASFPDWLQVEFAGVQTIDEIDVFTSQDNSVNPTEPTPDMTFALSGITSFEIQYWDGNNWTRVPGGNIDGNRLVWRKVAFAAITTNKIRVFVVGALGPLSRITEIEAYSDHLNIVPGTVFNSGFENGGLSPWVPFGAASISNAAARSGTSSFAVTDGAGGVYEDLTGLTPGAIYQVTAYAHAGPGSTGQAFLLVHDSTDGGSVSDGFRTPSGGWDPFTATFVARANGRMRIVLISSGGAGTLFWDDVRVTDASGFESGTSVPGVTFGSGSVSISNAAARSGTSSLAMTGGGTNGFYEDLTGLTPGSLYQVTVNAHADPGATSQALLVVHDSTDAGTVIDGWRAPGNGWNPFTVTFRATANGRMRIVLLSSGGSGTIYWDDIRVTDASGFELGNSVPGVQFGSGSASGSNAAARSGTSSLAMTGSAVGIYQDLTGLTPGSMYQVTVYAHADPGTTSQALLIVHDTTDGGTVVDGWRSPGSGWDAFNVTFTATPNGRMRIVLISSGGAGTIYWDDLHVTDASGFETANGVPGVTFGSGSVSVSNAAARSGNSSLAMTGSSVNGLYEDLTGLTPGALYQVTVYAHTDPGTTSQALLVAHDSTDGGTVTDGWRSPASGWDAFTVTFLARSNGRMRIVMFASGGSGTVYWDDLHVTDASSLEAGASTPGVSFGAGSVSVSNGASRSGKASLAMTGGIAGTYLDLAGLTPGALYQVNAYVHSDPGTSSQALLVAHDSTDNGTVTDGWRSPGGGWDPLTVTFLARANGRMRIVLISSGGTGTIYWDDIRVTDGGGFETGTAITGTSFGPGSVSTSNAAARSGTGSLAMSGVSTNGFYEDVTGLTPGALYKVTAYAHSDPGTTSQALLVVHDSTDGGTVVDGWKAPGSGWDPLTVTFRATANGRLRIVLFTSGGSGTIYWDDIHITDASSFETGGGLPGIPFGAGNVSLSNAAARSGTASLAMTGDVAGMYEDFTGLTPGVSYQVTVYAHAGPGTTSQGLLVVHDSTDGGTVIDGWKSPGSGWDAFTVNFTATANGRMRIVLISSGGPGTIYWDDIKIN